MVKGRRVPIEVSIYGFGSGLGVASVLMVFGLRVNLDMCLEYLGKEK